MVDGLHKLIQNRTMQTLAIAFSEAGSRRRDDGGNLTSVQYKPIQKQLQEFALFYFE
jgi:hypothetical protein